MSETEAPSIAGFRWQFGLRDFLLAVAVVAAYLGAFVVCTRDLAEPAFWRVVLAAVFGAVGGLGGFVVNKSLQYRAGASIAKLQRDRPM
jgi:hypothetical protein